MIEGDAAPRQRRAARALIIATAALASASVPFAHLSLPVPPVVAPMAGALAVVAQMLTAVMLYSRYRSSSLPSIAILTAVYATSPLTSIAFLLGVPSVTAHVGPRITEGLAPWCFIAGSIVFAAQAAAYVLADRAERRNRHASSAQMRARVLIFTACVVGAVVLLLPFVAFGGGNVLASAPLVALRRYLVVPLVLGGLGATFASVLPPGRRRPTMSRLWLAVTTLCTFVMLVFAGELSAGQFDLGWLFALAAWLLGSAAFLTAMVASVYNALSLLALRNDALYEQSVSDELTGLLNRRGFNARFEEQVRRSTGAEESLALLLIDIDDFKRYNDTFGHQGGDRAISAVARVVASVLRRSGDAGARIGGDEFAVILPKTDMAGAVAVAERIRNAVERLDLPAGDGARFATLTVTIGVASVGFSGAALFEAGATNAARETNVLLGRADAALYAAKDAGRNCVRARAWPQPARAGG